MSTKSLAWQLTFPSTIELNDTGPIPQPGPKQALVRIHAVSLNDRDRVIIDKSPRYPLPIAPSLVPGSDGAGIVEEVGPDSSSKIGEHVVIHPNLGSKARTQEASSSKMLLVAVATTVHFRDTWF